MVKLQHDIHVHIAFGAFGFLSVCHFDTKTLFSAEVIGTNYSDVAKHYSQNGNTHAKKKKKKKKKKKNVLHLYFIHINGAACNFSLYPFTACKIILM